MLKKSKATSVGNVFSKTSKALVKSTVSELTFLNFFSNQAICSELLSNSFLNSSRQRIII
jgi:hypothetical protein